MGRAGGPGEVRLPRPEDADRAADRGAAAASSAASSSILRRSRSTTRRPTSCCRAPKRSASSNWKVRACGARCSTCGPTVSRTSSRWSRSTGPARWRTSRPIARASTATEKPEYIHPKLEPILRETYGVIVYQEQVMQAAQILAGYTLGQADLLRRAMGKKIRSEMQAQRKDFVKGATERGIERSHADAIFDLLERFAEYGFNKSHAAAYALVAYQTAYHEGELSGRVHGGVDDARHGQHRQAFGIPRRGRAARHQGRAAVGQPLGRRLRGRGQHDLLRARRAQGRRPAGGRQRSSRRAATSRSPTSPISPAASIRARSTSACWKASPPPAPSMRSSRTARGRTPPSTP